MKQLLFRMMLTGVVCAAGGHASAGDWWLVYGEGDKPNRTVVYVNADSIYQERNVPALGPIDLSAPDPLAARPFIRIDGTTVYESASMPGKVQTRYLVDCTTRRVKSGPNDVRWRSDRVEEKPGLDWTLASTSAALSQIEAFVCDTRNGRTNAVRATDDYDPLPITWSTVWRDGTEPQWTTTRSAAEINAAIDKGLTETNALLASATRMAGAQLQTQEIDRDATILNQRRMLAKAQNRGTPLLQTWIGLTEADLVRAWGVPAGSHNSGASRFLSYAYGFSEVLVNRNGVQRPNRTLRCDLTLEIRDGRIVDFASSGNYCRTAAENLPKGRIQ
jgi:hypothetical protein